MVKSDREGSTEPELICEIEQYTGKYDFAHPDVARQYVEVEIEELDFEGRWTFDPGTFRALSAMPWDEALEELVSAEGRTIKSHKSSDRLRDVLEAERENIRRGWVEQRLKEIHVEEKKLEQEKVELEEELD